MLMADSLQGMLSTPFGSTGLLHENVNIKCTKYDFAYLL
jgi:hypothetical protein